jgi:tripartite-type tricarboxylate transporter receptor subunit TctC
MAAEQKNVILRTIVVIFGVHVIMSFVKSAVALAFAFAAGSAIAQAYPSRPIRIVSPGPPGGGTDVAARLIGQKLTEQWGQQVVVDNRGGAGGIIGIEVVAKAPPDGMFSATGTRLGLTMPHSTASISEKSLMVQGNSVPSA